MALIDSQRLYCPYCGELIELVLDLSQEQQCYVEDCPVCCRPMEVQLSVSDQGIASVQLQREDE